MAFQIETHAALGSTQTELKSRFKTHPGLSHLYSLRADLQTVGRGRSDHEWISISGNLHASILLRRFPPIGATWIPLWVGYSIFSALIKLGIEAENLKLKWPNDLLSMHSDPGGIKVGGILCEKVGDAVVAGVGLNLVSSPDLPFVGSLHLLNYSPHQVLEFILKELESEISLNQLRLGYLHHSYFQPEASVEWISEHDQTCHQGQVLGLGEYGELRVQENSRVVSLYSEEVRKVRTQKQG